MNPEQIMLMCNFDNQLIDKGKATKENKLIQHLWKDKWPIEDKDLCKRFISTKLDPDTLVSELKSFREDPETMEKVLSISISAFLTFCEYNWNSHPEKLDLSEYFGMEWPQDVDVAINLQKDSEPIYVNILYPELLYFSMQMFSALYSVESNLVNLWWNFRTKVVHQRILEDSSATLYSDLEMLIAKLYNELPGLQPRVQALLCVEIAQAYLVYGRVQPTEEYLLRARETVGLKLELTGILGKRTKYQQKLLPQIALSSELDSSMDRPTAEESHGDSELPPEIELEDDVRLNKIEYTDKVEQVVLPSLEQTICLVTVQYIQKSHPKDDLTHEELQPYIEAILSQKSGAWATRVCAMLVRCKLESNHKRTVERAMLQCEAIVNDKTNATAKTRLSYLFASGLQCAWAWRQQLAELYLSLGLLKAALEEFLALQLWEDVILCYTLLQLRHKAAEVIQQQIDLNPTVKLYCLLGDATDDVKCYEKAWEFSNYKSSRAQRHWGNFLFEHKKYEECIPHYEKSVEINSIQDSVWLRLGYAALLTEQWEISGKAYRRYTYLQPNSFEAWNNLAKVYLQQGDKARAYRALLEALRFNYDNWKLWENVITVSMDTGHFEDVLRGCHRLLDLLHKYDDAELLALLVRAVVDDIPDADGHGARRCQLTRLLESRENPFVQIKVILKRLENTLQKRTLELFGHITSIHQNKPELWQLYADLSPTYLLKAQRLLKAYRGYTQSGNWTNNPESCKKVIELAKSMLEYSLKARQEAEEKDILQANSQLSSARLTGQAVIRAVEKQDWEETRTPLEELKELFDIVAEYLKSIM